MKVLLAVDLSDLANDAARVLCRFPNLESMHVTLMTVVNPPEFGLNASTEMWYPDYIDHQRELVDARHEEVAAMLEAAGARVSRHITQGHIGGELVRYAELIAADWIVLDATGHSAIGRLLLGSVSDYVATHAKCAVLVLRPDTLSGSDPLKLSVAYDHSDSAKKVLHEVARRDWPRGAAMQLITAVTPVMVYRDDLFPSAQEEEKRRRVEAEAIAAQAAASITVFDAGVEVSVVEGEHTGDAILRAANAFGSHLIAVGDKGHGIFERLMLGSTSRYVLHHASQSILVVR